MRAAVAILATCVAMACAPETERLVAPSPSRAATTTAPPSAPLPSTATPAVTASRSPSPAVSVSGTARPSTTLPPGASLPAMPSQPALPNGVTKVASGTLVFTIAAGETRQFEPGTLIADAGASPVPTAALAWTVAWRATDSLSSAWYRQGAVSDIGHGRWGTAEIGGAGFQLRNDGVATVNGELSYLISSR